jgi:hypothetical protein
MDYQQQAEAEMWDAIAANAPRELPRQAYDVAPAPLPDDVQAFADVHEDGQTRLGVAGDQLAVLPLPAHGDVF